MLVTVRLLVMIVILCCAPAVVRAIALPRHVPVPGGVAVISVGRSTSPAPRAWYKGRIVMMVESEEKWVAVVGIPLKSKPGVHTLMLHYGSRRMTKRTFTVRDKQYEKEWITLKNRRMVNPNKRDLERIAKERERILLAFAHWTDHMMVEEPFLLPVIGRLSSPFGKQRYFNKQPRRPHSGLDIAAPEGTLVRAPAVGKVVEVGDFFFNGKTIFLDHGQGLVSMYCHLGQIDVRFGQIVRRGESIGLVGKTGRATGPHLHWSMSLNRTRVEPLLFLPKDIR